MLAQPSVIARLMGMEDTTVVPAQAAMTNLGATPSSSSSYSGEASPAASVVTASKPKKFKCSPLPHHGRISGDYYLKYCLNKMKPRRSRRSRSHRREHHPQEELLEKIKEEFRASWQHASMAAPQAATLEDGGSTVVSASGRRSGDRAGELDGRYIQRIAQDNLRREKLARSGHGVSGKTKVEDEEEDINAAAAAVVCLTKAEEAEHEQGGSEVAVPEEGSEEFFFRASGPAANGAPEHRSASTPIRIAVLRPIGAAGGSTGDRAEPALGTPPPSWKELRDGRGMEEFLRAVKERLDNEMKPKAGDGHLAPAPTTSTRRKGWGSDEAKGDTARRISEAAGMAKEDLGRRLSRLESFRVFRGDRGRRDAAAVKSPEHRMLKSVRARIDAMSPKKTRLGGSSSPVSSRGGRAWSPPPAYAGHVASLSDMGSDEEEEAGQSCCRGDQKRAMNKLWKVHGAAPRADTGIVVVPSPRALVRSFSAPTTSGIPSGGADEKLSRSRSFSLLRETVASGLRQSFSLGGKLLMTMIHLSKKIPMPTTMYSSSSNPHDSSKLITAAQADVLAPPSPVSPLDVHGRSPRHFSSCTFLPESSPKWSPKCSSECEASVGESPWRWRTAAERNDVDPDKAYIRELLIAAGLFDGDDDDDGGSSVARTESVAQAIMSDDVFYEVEDAYYYRRIRRLGNDDVDGAGEEEELEEHGAADWRRLLFDLANEALHVLQAGPSSSSLRRWFVDSGNGVLSSSRPRLRGRELEDDVWRQVARAMMGGETTPVTTVDGMVERDVERSTWMVLHGNVCAVGRKIERAIFDELVDDVLCQLFV
ncbi:unnamed protein product [Alopecurus aequalis]